ncbi:MAG: hypothetical protein AUG51_07070 [Acidobacteria bacterium 13_1_20CM_3_53_8]|nr:MAG: hypothetical protein AUG51_07070 [Acidobacteria bacterium 13_1_20CM_3_53_8]
MKVQLNNARNLQPGSMNRMQRMIARRILWIVIATALLAGISLAQSGTDVKQKKSPDLTGTWTTTITPPSESGAPPFKLLFTFTGDGNLLATGTAGDFPALGNPCHGVWTRTGDHTFALTYLCLDFDSSLQFTGSDKIRGTLNIDNATGQLSGRLDLTHFDTNNNLIFNGCCATAQGTRLQIEQLP